MFNRLMCFVIIVLCTAAPALANFCAFDNAPAASLLFPFVAFDYNDPDYQTTTEMSITNLSWEAQILHVTLWTDLGEAMLDFNILLTGYDMQRINIADILGDGQLVVTVSSGHNNYEGVRDAGPVSGKNELNSDWISGLMEDPEATHTLGTRCSSSDPGYPGQCTQPIPQTILDFFEEWLTMTQRVDFYHSDSCSGDFSGWYVVQGYPDPWPYVRDEEDLTWLYVTVDVVETCNNLFPSEYGYWVPFTDGGEARYDNVLTGEVAWRSPVGTSGGKAVHLEADQQLARVVAKSMINQPTSFYHRYSSNQGQACDAREPLPTAWALRYQDAMTAETSKIRVWKGSTNFMTPIDLQADTPFDSPSEIVASNCFAYTYYAWDEDENVVYSSWGGPPPGWDIVEPNILPFAVQEVGVDQFYLPDESGWILFVWPPSNYGQGWYAPDAPDAYQTWMGVVHDAWGSNAHFVPGTVMGNANCFTDQILPDLGVDYDYVDRYGYRGRSRAVSGPPVVD